MDFNVFSDPNSISAQALLRACIADYNDKEGQSLTTRLSKAAGFIYGTGHSVRELGMAQGVEGMRLHGEACVSISKLIEESISKLIDMGATPPVDCTGNNPEDFKELCKPPERTEP